MKRKSFTVLALMLCLSLCLLLAPGAFAEEEKIAYDNGTIVGFDTSVFSDTIDLDHKYSLVALQKVLPAQLAVYTGGIVTYGEGSDGAPVISSFEGTISQVVDVTWECLEDYDKRMDSFHFVPVFKDYELADALENPVITVNVLGQLPIPPLMPFSTEREHHASWFISDDMRYDSPGYPAAYSNRANMPQIRDQNPYGTCWAFATIAAVEADLIHDGAADSNIDLSELHLAYFTYHNFYDEKGNNIGDTVTINPSVITRPDGSTVLYYLEHGGSTYYAAQTLANMLGPVEESQVPYSNANGNEPFTEEGRLRSPVQITDVYYIYADDMGAVKDAIMTHGAVSAAFHAADGTEYYEDFYSSQYNCFYYPAEVGTNHVITLVGWDDSFPASRFVTAPEGNGAWLVRNSWGDNNDSYWGYFWLSYYDKSLGGDMYAFDAQPWQYDHCYAYDNSPASFWMGSYDNGLVLSQTFQVDGGEQIEAIGFTLEDADTTVSFTLTCGDRSVTATANSGPGGYHLVPLSEPLVIAERSSVTLEMEYISAPYGAYAYGENSTTYGDVTFSAVCGSSGLMANGYPVTFNGNSADGRLKLFTNDTNITGIAISSVNFPDPVFRTYVSDNIDTDKSGYLDDAEIAAVTEINVRGKNEEGAQRISTLKGIEHFPSLLHLDCAGNSLTELDVSKNTALKTLTCGIMDNDGNVFGNQLSKLDVSKNTALEYLYCTHNQISSLDASNHTALVVLYCYNNGMTHLNISGCTSLTTLSCGNNQLTSLDVGSNTALKLLYCHTNPALSTLDVSHCEMLNALYCQSSGITALNITGCTQLQWLNCSSNSLSSLDLSSCINLHELVCFANSLTELDITGCPVLVLTRYAAEPEAGNGMIIYYDDNFGNAIVCDEAVNILIYGLLELPADVTEIEEEAFADGAFIYVKLAEGTTSVGPRAFANCPNLFILYVPTQTEIDPTAFEGSYNAYIYRVGADEIVPAIQDVS